MSSLYYKPTEEFKTQKVKGISEIVKRTQLDLVKHKFGTDLCRNALVYPYDKDIIHQMIQRTYMFARPCPTVPKHGFVDSKIIYHLQEVGELYEKIIKIDPDGELLLMPYVTSLDGHASCTSAVLTPYSFVYGIANDSATSGNGVIFSFRFNHIGSPSYFLESLKLPNNKAALGIHNVPYVEIVYPYSSDYNGQVVQIRDGERPPKSCNYIPEKCEIAGVQYTTVEKHLCDCGDVSCSDTETVEIDLLEWDKITNNIQIMNSAYVRSSSNKRIIVYMPGKSSTCHYAVHCLAKGIPFICDNGITPSVGDVLEPEVDTSIHKWNKSFDRMGMVHTAYRKNRTVPSFITQAVRVPADSSIFHKLYADQAATFMSIALFTAHNVVNMEPTPEHVRLFVTSVMGYVHISTAIIGGELRHMAKRYKGKVKRRTKTPPIPKFWGTFKPTNRDHVQFRYLTKEWDDLGGILTNMIADFSQEGWVGGFGGPKWADCARSVLDLYEAVNTLIKDQNMDDLYDVLQKWHTSINMEHNGDSTMATKVVSATVFNEVQYEPWSILKYRSTINMMLDLVGRGSLHG